MSAALQTRLASLVYASLRTDPRVLVIMADTTARFYFDGLTIADILEINDFLNRNHGMYRFEMSKPLEQIRAGDDISVRVLTSSAWDQVASLAGRISR